MRPAKILRVVLVGLLAGAAASGTSMADTHVALPVACRVRGHLIVNDANEVHFSAAGSCGAFKVTIQDRPAFQWGGYPTWSGSCGYGPGPFPTLRMLMAFADAATGTLQSRSIAYWQFPNVVVGDRRFVDNSALPIVIRKAQIVGPSPGPEFEVPGAIVGRGLLLTRIGGGCDLRSPSKTKTVVTFALVGDGPRLDIPVP